MLKKLRENHSVSIPWNNRPVNFFQLCVVPWGQIIKQ